MGGEGRSTSPLTSSSCDLAYNDRSFRLRLHCKAWGSTTPHHPALFLPTRGDAKGTVGDGTGEGADGEAMEGLYSWLGLQSFLVLSPSAPRKVSRHEAGLLLSALTIAAVQASCCVPLLVRVGEAGKREYWGRSSTR